MRIILLTSLSLLFSQTLNLGEYISLKDHPKSKGVNLKLQPPDGWEIREANRPNTLKIFVYNLNTYMIIIKDNSTFFSRNQTSELLNDNEYVNSLVTSITSAAQDVVIIKQSIVTVDTYPTLEIISTGRGERLGIETTLFSKHWIIFYEDKIVMLMSNSIDYQEFQTFDPIYTLITNSIIFPDQYN